MMTIEKFSCYEFEVRKHYANKNEWDYIIYDPYYKPSENTILLESTEWFEAEGEARLAAIGHITLLENGEG